MKRILLNLLVSCFVAISFAQTTAEMPTIGSGTAGEPYEIATLANLRWLSENNSAWNKHFIQTADIDATETVGWNSGAGFSPIGNNSKKFTGKYNGQYHSITNLFIKREYVDYIALFGFASSSATIEKLKLEDVNIKGYKWTGTVVGKVDNATVYQVSATGKVDGYSYVGGVCGENKNGFVKETFSNVEIYVLDKYAGGICGFIDEGNILNNYSFSTLFTTAITETGGIIGENDWGSTVTNNYFAGQISTISNKIGGIVGGGDAPSTQSGNFWDSEASGITKNIGNGQPKTTVQMKHLSTYKNASWNFKFSDVVDPIWNISDDKNDGYPYLNWQYPDGEELSGYTALINIKSISENASKEIEIVVDLLDVGFPTATEFGVCYATDNSPTTDDTTISTTTNIQTGELTFTVTDFDINTLYYFKAYAINSVGTYYSNVLSFAIFKNLEAEPLGDGTEENPYKISTINELLWVSTNSNSWNKHFVQTADIDADITKIINNGEGFSPIGDSNIKFTGTYDGGYNKIENLYINIPSTHNVGLFGYINNAKIEKLTLDNLQNEGNRQVGGIVGQAENSAIYRIFVTGEIAGYDAVGGICGQNLNSIIEECGSDALISTSGDYAAGIVGYNNGGQLIHNYSVSTLSTGGFGDLGGLIGFNTNSSTSALIENYSASTFKGANYSAGGLIARGYEPATETLNFWDFEISGVTDNIGSVGGSYKTDRIDMANPRYYYSIGWDIRVKNSENIRVWNMDSSRNNGYPYLSWQFPEQEGVDVDVKAKIIIENTSLKSTYGVEIELFVDFIGNPIADEIGICFGAYSEPTIDDNFFILDEIKEGRITVVIPNVEPNRNYFRPYSISGGNVSYNEEVMFLTINIQEPEGEGSAEKPYKIETFNDLLWVSENPSSWDKHFVQTADINALYSYEINSGEGFSPIGNSTTKFTGQYDGGYHTISNLLINRPSTNYQALFGYIENAVVQKLVLENINVKGYEYVGGCVGYGMQSTVYQGSVTGNITGYKFVGGNIGGIEEGVAQQLFSAGSVTATYEYPGGVAGYSMNGIITDNYSMSIVTGGDYTYSGGVIGFGNYDATGIIDNNNYFIGTFGNPRSYNYGVLNGGTYDSNALTKFWNKEINEGIYEHSNSVAKTTAEMKDVNTYLNVRWDFKLPGYDNPVWNIGNDRNDGYPYFIWQYPNDPFVDAILAPHIIVESATVTSVSNAEVEINIKYFGNPKSYEIGVCYGLTPNPTTDDFTEKMSDDIENGNFAIQLSDLETHKYFIRTYAISDEGTYYGNEIELVTIFETEPKGEGSEEEPYKIASFNELLWVSNNPISWDKHFIQTADINAITSKEIAGGGFSPIGNYSEYFTGNYDGQHFTIENLYINRPESDHQALFGYIENANIERVIVKDANIEGKYQVGGIVGHSNYGRIYQSSFTGDIKAFYYAGGIVGFNHSSTIEECYTNAVINVSENAAGGIAGTNNYGTIKNNYSVSSISVDNQNGLGGIIGYNSGGVVVNNYFSGNFGGLSAYRGGVIGDGSYPDIDKGNFWDEDVTGVESNLGNAERKSTEEMQSFETFFTADWKLKLTNSAAPIWNMRAERNNGYPYFNWQYPNDDEISALLPTIHTMIDLNQNSPYEFYAVISVEYVGSTKADAIGICYGLDETPTVDDNVANILEVIEGEFIITIENINPYRYYVRPYYKVGESVYYGEVQSILTLFVHEPINGDGTINNPYKISSFNELVWITNYSDSWDKHFIQTADIDAIVSKEMSYGAGITAIGSNYRPFKGSYNGNHYKIENLNINRPNDDRQGLFGEISNATIKGVVLDNVDVRGKDFVGGLVGYSVNSTISQSSVSGIVSGNENVGGIVGRVISGTIEQSFVDADIFGENNNVGGIIGYNYTTTIKNNYCLSNIYATGNYYSGGIIGYNNGSTVVNNYFAGKFTGTNSNKGGIIAEGDSPSPATGNFWDSEISGVTYNKGQGTAKLTAEMREAIMFKDAGWEFKIPNATNPIWNIGNERNNGYPYFNWQFPNDEVLSYDPHIKINNLEYLSSTEVKFEINILDLGSPLVSEVGICYGLSPKPTVNDDFVVITTNAIVGQLEATISSLDAGELYFYRIYAVSEEGTSYLNENHIVAIVKEDLKGEGSEINPYEISSINELLFLSGNSNMWHYNFIQTTNIDALITKDLNGGKGFSPIGNLSTSFSGSYNGDYHKISNLFIEDKYSDNLGLFGYIHNATVEKLVVDNAYVLGRENVGIVVGYNSDASINQTAATGEVRGVNNVGAICGQNFWAKVNESYSEAEIYITGESVGGVVGYNNRGDLYSNYSVSKISAVEGAYAGGVIGKNSGGAVHNCYFAGTFGEELSTKGGIIAGGGKPTTEMYNIWDREITGVTANIGDSFSWSLTTDEMKNIESLPALAWEFVGLGRSDIWDIDDEGIVNNGYPYLSWAFNIKDDINVGVIDKSDNNSTISIYPNPFNDIVTITGNGINSVKVYTMSGVQMLDAKYNSESEVTIQTSNFDKGIYLFVVENGGNMETYKLVKK